VPFDDKNKNKIKRDKKATNAGHLKITLYSQSTITTTKTTPIIMVIIAIKKQQ